MTYHFVAKSRNDKTGPMPVTTTSAETCPDACPLKSGGCYAKGGKVAMHWAKVTAGTRGGDLAQFAACMAGYLRHKRGDVL